MESNNNAPFYPGQEIVRIKKTQDGIGKIGDGHIAYKCEQCKKCKKWYVDIGERVRPHADIFRSVCNCGHKQEMPEPIVWYSCSQFAPIQHQYTDISKELADGLPYYKEEVPDKVMVPEKAPASIENQFLEGNEEMIKVFNQLSPEDQKLYAPRVAEMIELGKTLFK